MLAILMLVAAASTTPKPGELKSFDDWAVGCDNGRACTAVSLMEMESGENQLTIQITRNPQSAAPAKLRIANVEQKGSGGTVSFVRDGTEQIATAPLPANGDPIELALEPTTAQAFSSGRTLELRDSHGQPLGSASLKGVKAALAFMDVSQGRKETITALVDRGANPAASVPPPTPLPNIKAPRAPKADSILLSREDMSILQTRTGCDASGDVPLPQEVSRIDGRHWLVMVPCGSGTYNFMGAPILISGNGKGRKMKPADFDYLPQSAANEGSVPVLANASWDAARGELVSYAKGRGLGDCGSAETYVWDGRRFRLIAQTVMDECRGVIDWIPTWRANVTRR